MSEFFRCLGFLSLLMVYVVHKPVEGFIFRMHEEVVSVMTFVITVCAVHDFSNAFRKAMDLRELLIQAEQIREELEQRAAEKRRLLEATATFVRAAMEESLEEKKDRFTSHAASKEDLIRHLEEEMQKLEKRQEHLKERMTKNAERLLLHSPNSRFMTKVTDTGEIRERIREKLHKRFIS